MSDEEGKIDYFIRSTDDRLERIEAELRSLNAFKGWVLGASAFAGALAGYAVKLMS